MSSFGPGGGGGGGEVETKDERNVCASSETVKLDVKVAPYTDHVACTFL